MTATTAAAAALRIFAEADSPDELVVLVFGDGATITANAYVRDIGAIEGHTPWTWACGADLAQWGTFRRREGDYTRDILWTLREHDNSVIADRHPDFADRSAALALHADF